MSLDAPSLASPRIDSMAQLVAWMQAGARPDGTQLIGLETEKLGVVAKDGSPAPLTGERSIDTLLRRVADRLGAEVLEESGVAIGVKLARGTLSLEPGGQLELSGGAYTRLGDIDTELRAHLDLVRELSEPLGLAWLATGYRPFGPRDAVPWLPRGRYALMRRRLPGVFAHDMMQLTASVQVNFDFESEADCARKVSTAMAVSPLVAAMTANSPVREGVASGFESFRYHVWSDVDPARSGLRRFMYEPGFTFERYIDWALGVPMLFIRRGGEYVDPAGRTLRDVWRDGFAGEPANMVDFVDVLSTLFPEVRVKRVIEVRGSDAVDEGTSVAIAALWTAVLYDRDACAAARALVELPFDDLAALQPEIARVGMAARTGAFEVRERCGELLKIAEAALQRRGEPTAWLAPLRETVATGKSPARRLLDRGLTSPAQYLEAMRY